MKLAEKLPSGSGLVLRTFGDQGLRQKAPLIAAIAEHREIMLLIAGDPDLATEVGANGVHWPEARLHQAAKSRFEGLQTASAHSPSAVRRAQELVDAVFVSAAFLSNSPSAGRPLGPFRLASYARRSTLPVYALGGINERTAKRLASTGIYGAGAIEGLMEKPD